MRRGCAQGVMRAPERLQVGMALTDTETQLADTASDTRLRHKTVHELADIGFTTLVLTPVAWMRSVDDDRVRMLDNASRSARDDRLRADVEDAKERKLHAILKPELWIEDGGRPSDVQPSDPDGWARFFESYAAFVLHYAQLAEALKVDGLVLGTGLSAASTEHPQRWTELIAKVRTLYPGKVAYAANQEKAKRIAWWDALDAIGIQLDGPLAHKNALNEDAVRAGLRRAVRELEDVAKRFEKPIWITEVGYRSVSDPFSAPHAPLTANGSHPIVDQQAQALGYKLVFEAAASTASIEALFWKGWHTEADGDTEAPYGLSARGKMAEAVLRAALSPACATSP